MLSAFVFTGVVAMAMALSITEDGHYDTKYNHLDIERVLNNKRLVTYYGMCLLGEGACTPQGTEFKRILPEALRTNCARCTEKQKVTTYFAIRRLKKEYPVIWQRLQASWDPTGELVSRFINHVETSSSAPVTSSMAPAVGSRFGDVETSSSTLINNRFSEVEDSNEINSPSEVPLTQTQTQNMPRTENTTPVVTSQRITNVASSTPQRITNVASSTPEFPSTSNYRTSPRPTRFNIVLPRPGDLGRLTANWIGSIGDIGTKVIRTGARIADMVISGVQASVRGTING